MLLARVNWPTTAGCWKTDDERERRELKVFLQTHPSQSLLRLHRHERFVQSLFVGKANDFLETLSQHVQSEHDAVSPATRHANSRPRSNDIRNQQSNNKLAMQWVRGTMVDIL